MVMSRQYPRKGEERRTDGGGRGCKPKGAYKEVPRPSRRLGWAAAKSTLTVLNKDIIDEVLVNIIIIENLLFYIVECLEFYTFY